MKHIVSPENSLIKKAIGLKQRKIREKEGLYLIEGLHLCREALGSIDNIESLLVRESSYQLIVDNELHTIIKQFQKLNVPVVSIEDKLFGRLMDTETPQALAAIMRYRSWDSEDFFAADNRTGHGNLLILDRIQDPGNAGTLLRTAEAAGYQGIIAIKGTVDLYSPKVVRAAAGSLFRMPLLFTENAEDTLKLLHDRGKRVVVATPYCDKLYFQVPLDKDAAFVIGNEAGGVSTTFLEMSDCQVKIPMSEPVESLNAAVAAAILMYESYRQNFHKEAEEK